MIIIQIECDSLVFKVHSILIECASLFFMFFNVNSIVIVIRLYIMAIQAKISLTARDIPGTAAKVNVFGQIIVSGFSGQ